MQPLFSAVGFVSIKLDLSLQFCDPVLGSKKLMRKLLCHRRLLPEWFVDAGAISIYYSSRALRPAKTRVFVDFVVESFRRNRLAERFSAQAKRSTSRSHDNSTHVR